MAQLGASSAHPFKWEFPGGKVHENEDPFSALERELKEELGIETKSLNHFITITHDYGVMEIRLTALFTEYISGEFHLKDHDRIEFVEKNQLLDFGLTAADVPVAEELIRSLS